MNLLQMSFSGAAFITAVVIIRAVAINKLPKKTFLVLWELVILRLLIPFSIPSMFSVYTLVTHSGEAALAMAENDNLDYSVPKEGSNLWIDSWFIPKSCTNQTNALKFLNFLCKDDIAEKNFEYVQYASPITSVVENQDADVKNNEAINPSSDTIKRCEIYKALSDDDSAKYTKLWQELLSY